MFYWQSQSWSENYKKFMSSTFLVDLIVKDFLNWICCSELLEFVTKYSYWWKKRTKRSLMELWSYQTFIFYFLIVKTRFERQLILICSNGLQTFLSNSSITCNYFSNSFRFFHKFSKKQQTLKKAKTKFVK